MMFLFQTTLPERSDADTRDQLGTSSSDSDSEDWTPRPRPVRGASFRDRLQQLIQAEKSKASSTGRCHLSLIVSKHSCSLRSPISTSRFLFGLQPRTSFHSGLHSTRKGTFRIRTQTTCAGRAFLGRTFPLRIRPPRCGEAGQPDGGRGVATPEDRWAVATCCAHCIRLRALSARTLAPSVSRHSVTAVSAPPTGSLES